MKKMIKKILTVLFTLTLFVSITSIGVFAEEHQGEANDQSGKATLTISNLNPGDKVRVWQIITITYDSSNNTLSYSFTPAAKKYFDSKSIDINSFMAYTDNIDGLKTALAGLPEAIRNNRGTGEGKWNNPWTNLENVEGGTVEDGVVTIGDSGTITIKNCKAGGYFIEPCASTVVYQPMFASIIPYVAEGSSGQGYSYSDKQLAAKHTSVSISKSVKRHGSDTWADTANVSYNTVDSDSNFSTVDFKTVAAIPTYVYGTNNVLKIVETLPNGLSTTTDSVKVYGASTDNEQGTLISNIPTNAITVSTDGKIVTLDFGGDNYNVVNSYNYIRVEYNASVSANAAIASIEGSNRVGNVANTVYTYTCYPYLSITDTNKTIEANTKIYTGGLSIKKYDSEDNTKMLQNAAFKLYRADTNGTVSLTKDGHSINVTEIANDISLTTDVNGVVNLPGLSSDAEYYLVETVAPSGYKLDNTPIHVSFDLNKLNEHGYFTVNIANSKANLSLPTTGATGMVAFTVSGLVIMAAAVAILVKARDTH